MKNRPKLLSPYTILTVSKCNIYYANVLIPMELTQKVQLKENSDEPLVNLKIVGRFTIITISITENDERKGDVFYVKKKKGIDKMQIASLRILVGSKPDNSNGSVLVNVIYGDPEEGGTSIVEYEDAEEEGGDL